MTQDITAERSRLMRDGKRGGALVSSFEETETHTFTYNGDGTVATLVKDKVQPDGAVWRKTITFLYDTGRVTSKTETLEVLP